MMRMMLRLVTAGSSSMLGGGFDDIPLRLRCCNRANLAGGTDALAVSRYRPSSVAGAAVRGAHCRSMRRRAESYADRRPARAALRTVDAVPAPWRDAATLRGRHHSHAAQHRGSHFGAAAPIRTKPVRRL